MKKTVLCIMAVVVVCLGADAQLTTKARKAQREVALQRSAPQMEMKRIDNVVKSQRMSKTALNNAPVKEILSTRKLKNGAEIRIVRLENGMIKKQLFHSEKQLQRKVSINRKPNQSAGSATATAAVETLSEGFEGWDGDAWDWLPAGWTDESKAGSASDITSINDDRYNFTWRTCDGGLFTPPKKGNYCAGVQFATSFDIFKDNNAIPYNPPMPQDEWLISPAIAVKQADYVYAFDLFYDPFWARVSLDEDFNYTFDAMHTVVEVLISTDGGTIWTKKWDSKEDALSYTEDELWDMALDTSPWLKVSVDLREYLNKDVKIAIRYWDDGGESVYVDNVMAGIPAPEVSYRRPEGYLISGFSEDYFSLTANLIVGNAYTPTKWRGIVENQESLRWNFLDFDGVPVYTSTEKNPIVTLPHGLLGDYQTPVLTATGKGGTTGSFQLGVEDEYNLMSLGGDNIVDESVFGLGNYDPNQGITIYTNINAEGMESYGTFKGVANYFEKPANKYLFEMFYVHALDVEAKPGEPVRLDLYAVDEKGIVGDIIATSETYPEDFILAFEEGGHKYYTIPFKFMVKDEDGRERESYIEMENAFIAEFHNYKSAYIVFQRNDHPTGDRYAYVSLEERYLSLGATSACFDMDATFPFLAVLNDELNIGRYSAPNNGGTKEFDIITYWTSASWDLKEALPNWITLGNPVSQGDAIYKLSVTVASLPQGVSGRSADITIQSPGCGDITLKIKQGDGWFVGIDQVNPSQNVKVVNQDDYFLLTYPEGISSISVYNVAGQKVGEYALSSIGTFSIPTGNWAKGIYILKFTGKTSETVKVFK